MRPAHVTQGLATSINVTGKVSVASEDTGIGCGRRRAPCPVDRRGQLSAAATSGQKRLRTISAALLGLMVVIVAPARADLIQTFDATGIFEDGAILSGNLTIDITTGQVAALDLTIGPPFSQTFTTVDELEHDTTNSITSIVSITPNNTDITLVLPVVTLIDYPGGVLSSLTDPVPGHLLFALVWRS